MTSAEAERGLGGVQETSIEAGPASITSARVLLASGRLWRRDAADRSNRRDLGSSSAPGNTAPKESRRLRAPAHGSRFGFARFELAKISGRACRSPSGPHAAHDPGRCLRSCVCLLFVADLYKSRTRLEAFHIHSAREIKQFFLWETADAKGFGRPLGQHEQKVGEFILLYETLPLEQ